MIKAWSGVCRSAPQSQAAVIISPNLNIRDPNRPMQCEDDAAEPKQFGSTRDQ